MIANGVSYISSGDTLYAVNATTGATLWTHGFDGAPCSVIPTVANGTVYIGVYADHGMTNGVYALDAMTGALRWYYGYGEVSSLTVANGILYFVPSGTTQGGVSAVNANTGQFLWFYAAEGGLYAPAVANGLVYTASSYGGIYAVNATTGALVWADQTGNQASIGPVADGLLYAASYGSVGTLYGLDASTGALVWKHTNFTTSTAVATGVLYALSTDASLYALNARTGAIIWKSADPAAGYVSVANGVVYSSAYQQLYALDAKTGATLWNYPANAVYPYSPVVANGMVYIGSTTGLLAFHLPDQ